MYSLLEAHLEVNNCNAGRAAQLAECWRSPTGKMLPRGVSDSSRSGSVTALQESIGRPGECRPGRGVVGAVAATSRLDACRQRGGRLTETSGGIGQLTDGGLCPAPSRKFRESRAECCEYRSGFP